MKIQINIGKLNNNLQKSINKKSEKKCRLKSKTNSESSIEFKKEKIIRRRNVKNNYYIEYLTDFKNYILKKFQKIKLIFKNIKLNNRFNNKTKINENIENENIINGNKRVYRRQRKKENKINIWYKNFFKNNNKLEFKYYVLLISMFLLLGASIAILSKSNNVLNSENYTLIGENSNDESIEETVEAVSSIVNDTEETKKETKEEKTNTKINSNTNTNTNTNANANTVTTTKKETIDPEKEVISFVKPVEGQVIKEFSKDKLLYSKTLGIWKTHKGVDISAKIGTEIKSAERGKVTNIYDDSLYGTTIEITHRQGYVTKYSNLDENVLVKLNDEIDKGQKVGRIGQTAISEIEDDPHLHFEMYIYEEVKNPLEYIKY